MHIAEFGYSFTLLWHSTKVELKHLIWDFQTKNVESSLPKYSEVTKLWEATEKVLRLTIYVQSPLHELDCFHGTNKLPTNSSLCQELFSRGLNTLSSLMPLSLLSSLMILPSLNSLDDPLLADQFDDPPLAEQLRWSSPRWTA